MAKGKPQITLVDEVTAQLSSDMAVDTKADLITQLQAELKSCQAELKIHKDAWASEADKFAALSAMVDREKMSMMQWPTN
jgi:capsule polysaccharide export protein KpsE/RkpR